MSPPRAGVRPAYTEEAFMDERKNTIGEEVRAVGERISGAAKDVAGAATGNAALEREGERERAEGRARQAANDAVSPSSEFGNRLVTSPACTGRRTKPRARTTTSRPSMATSTTTWTC